MPDRQSTIDRRSVLKTLGGAVVLGSVAANPVSAHPAALSHQLNTVRTATRKYRDIQTAIADGFSIFSPFVPGMGFHFASPDGHFGTDLEDPGLLVYFPNESSDLDPGDELNGHADDLILGGVEWLVSGDRSGNPPSIFDDEANARTLLTTEDEGWHYESVFDFTGLHAWVHRNNPEGVFHPTNPTIG